MTIPPHIINIYNKPRRGSEYLKRFLVSNYRHTISANGWFDTASCTVQPSSVSDAYDFLVTYIGNFVQVYVDNPAEPIFEGLINRISLSNGGITTTISLDEMYNSLQVYSSTSTSVQAVTTAVQNLTSQNLYGIKQGSAEYGFHWGGTGAQPTALGDKILNTQSFPQSSTEVTPGAQFELSVELIGIYQTLKWQLFFSSSSVSQTYSAFVLARLSALSNGTTFFDNANTGGVTTNTASRATGDSPGKTVWDSLDSNAQCGDGSGVPWVVGVEPTNFATGTRRLYYRPTNTSVEYYAYVSDGMRPRYVTGGLVHPWLVRPDRVIQIQDSLVGYTFPSFDDPRQTYINAIDYDAEAQQVRFYGYDDITNEAAVGARNNRPVIFGQPLRAARWRVG
jgi:hypothetical protein